VRSDTEVNVVGRENQIPDFDYRPLQPNSDRVVRVTKTHQLADPAQYRRHLVFNFCAFFGAASRNPRDFSVGHPRVVAEFRTDE
jgi:hypothetical protein